MRNSLQLARQSLTDKRTSEESSSKSSFEPPKKEAPSQDSPPPSGKVHDYWNRAYKLLSEDPEKATLLQEYTEVLKRDFNFSVEDIAKGVDLGHEWVMKIAQAQQSRTQDDKAWEITVAKKTFKLTTILESTAKAIVSIKDTVDTVGMFEPHVRIALAGLGIFLPVSSRKLLFCDVHLIIYIIDKIPSVYHMLLYDRVDVSCKSTSLS